jgi:hypothetical protein
MASDWLCWPLSGSDGLPHQVQLELPQINLLSKVDLIESYGELAFGLDFYTDVLDPSRLLPLLQVIAYDCGCCLCCRCHL